MTLDQLKEIFPYAKAKADLFIDAINTTMEEYEINTPLRQSAFLAQIGHESAQLRYVEEIASGAAYEGRLALGNTEKGDGRRFKGRGLIQITGRSNYKRCGDAFGIDLIASPEMLTQTTLATRSAGWYWDVHRLNKWADSGDMQTITRRINGGLNGLADRLELYDKAMEVLNA